MPGLEARPRGRNAHIDFLRGVAILLVLLLHYALAYRLANFPLAPLIGEQALRAVFLNGNYGVTMFFVVSGYLITSMSLARWGEPARMNWRAFYVFRFARIMPCILLALAIIVSLGLLDVPYFQNRQHGEPMPDSFFATAALSVLTFWHNVLMQSEGWFNYCLNIYWSLSVEEVFYLALPLVFLALRRQWAIALGCLALVVAAPIYRGLHADDELFFECGYLANFDAIAMGVLVAFIAARRKIDGTPAKLLRVAGGLGIAVFYLRGIDGHEVSGFSLVALCTALYLAGSVRDDGASFATGRLTAFVRWFGRHSYELYLFHIVVLALARNACDRDDLPAWAWLPWMLLYVGVSALAAMVVSRWLSEPANRAIRRRFA
ncbi:MAG TPA: acyltransferase [Steroidobacteraceae bacterium]|nr:acyltransferase [Steroidobacteraceae bacterium]